MQTNPDKAAKEPTEPSARTLKILMSWEKKHGLEVIRQHLDEGLFSREPAEQRLCYRWLRQRKAARRNNVIVEASVGASLILGIVAYFTWPD